MKHMNATVLFRLPSQFVIVPGLLEERGGGIIIIYVLFYDIKTMNMRIIKYFIDKTNGCKKQTPISKAAIHEQRDCVVFHEGVLKTQENEVH